MISSVDFLSDSQIDVLSQALDGWNYAGRDAADLSQNAVYLMLRDLCDRRELYRSKVFCVVSHRKDDLVRFSLDLRGNLGDLFVLMFSVAVEHQLLVADGSECVEKILAMESSAEVKYADGRLDLRLISARFLVGRLVVNSFVQSANFATLRDLASNLGGLEALNAELEEKREYVNKLKNVLERYKTEITFMSLDKAFEDMRDVKLFQKNSAFVAVIFFGIGLFVPPLVDLYYGWGLSDIQKIVSLCSLELLVVYFFRLAWASVRSLEKQVLQLDLRIALCASIQGYAEYSAKIKKDSPAVFEKFESLVFSGIVADDQAIPSVFDGADQLVKIVDALKKGRS